MTGEIRTLILTVDLECRLCSKKIKKAICKLQERECIQKIEYDEKKNTVTISGPFDPVKLKNKLCCKACEVIQNINIIEPKPVDNKPKPNPEPKLKPNPEPEPKPNPNPEPKPKPVSSSDTVARKPDPVYMPFWPVGVTIPVPVCRCGQYYVGCNDICRCCTYGCRGVGPHSLPVVGKPVTYQFSSDSEEAPPPCSVM